MHASITHRGRATSKEEREGGALSPAENNGEPRRQEDAQRAPWCRGEGQDGRPAVAEQQSDSLPAGLSELSDAILFINRSFIVQIILNLQSLKIETYERSFVSYFIFVKGQLA